MIYVHVLGDRNSLEGTGQNIMLSKGKSPASWHKLYASCGASWLRVSERISSIPCMKTPPSRYRRMNLSLPEVLAILVLVLRSQATTFQISRNYLMRFWMLFCSESGALVYHFACFCRIFFLKRNFDAITVSFLSDLSDLIYRNF
jgi:hypothetical protein